MKHVLRIEELTVFVNEKNILNIENLQIPKGKITCVVGKSGAGKSTFLKCLVKLIPAEGKIRLLNGIEKPYNELETSELRKRVTYLPQSASMFPGSVYDNLRIAAKLRGSSDGMSAPIAQSLLNQVNLNDVNLDQNAENLSGGEKQRLALARTLIGSPLVLLLDEPTSSLDPITKKFFDEQIRSLVEADNNLSLVIITHSIYQMMNIADHLIILHEGKLAKSASMEDIFGSMELRKKVLKSYDEAEVLDKLTRGDFNWQ